MEMFFAYYLWTIVVVAGLIQTYKTKFELYLGEWIVGLIASVIPGVNVMVAMGLLLGFAID